MEQLFTRKEFREKVFQRDGNKCVICNETKNLDAHHIVDRRLWDDGGYYLSNGVTLCSTHHIQAEQTVLSCNNVRDAAKIKTILLPPTFYNDEQIDKWGNIILPNGQRFIGELFFDESVHKILELGGVLNQFTKFIKYPKTQHLPWSPGITKDDRVMKIQDLEKNFGGKEVVISEKVDGENTTCYNNYIHARSIDGRNHVSRNWIKNLHSKIKYDIPEGWRICGENLYAKHTIAYSNLPSYFLVFAIFNEKNTCLSFLETVEYCKLLGLSWVQPKFIMKYDEKFIKENCYTGNSMYGGEQEGYVIRLSSEIPFTNYKNSIAKYVRKNHVQTNQNWMYQPIIKNKLSI
jgi:hypothetical protein